MKIKCAEGLFVVLVILSYALFQRGLHESAAGVIQIMTFVLLPVVEFGTLLLFLRYNGEILVIVGQNRLLLLFTLLLMLSTAWSVDRWHTFFFSIHLLLTTLLAFYVVARFSLQELIQILATALGILAVISLIAVVLRPDAAVHHGLHEGKWRGIYFHKNGMGREMAIGAVVFLIAAQQKCVPKLLAIAGFVLCVLLAVKSRGVTGLIALATVLALYPFLRALRFQLSVKVLTTVILLVSAGVIADYLASSYVTVLPMLGKDVTLSNRIFVWGYSWSSILENPVLGYGYNAFWLESELVLAELNWSSPHAHNNILELLLDVGVIGAVLFGIVLIRALMRAVSALFDGRIDAMWIIMILMLLTVVSGADSGIHWPYNLMWLTFVTSVCYASIRSPVHGISGTSQVA